MGLESIIIAAMDFELLVALCVLWFSSTVSLITAGAMWFWNEGEAFHPHSVAIEQRHSLFIVVRANTVCKMDFAVKSISAFIAPRGSSSSKYFTALLIMSGIAGFLGTTRWYSLGVASFLETSLAQAGFLAMVVVAIFELDVSPVVFLEEKLLVTSWLLEKLNLDKNLGFSTSPYSKDFLSFIRSSPLSHLYEEDIGSLTSIPAPKLNYSTLWTSLHVVGATAYVVLVTTAILLNDLREERVAWITGAFFLAFCFLGYLTGTYIPVMRYFRGWIILWNPFLKEPQFMYKLKKAVETYKQQDAMCTSITPVKRRGRKPKEIEPSQDELDKANACLDNIFLQYAQKHPQQYLKLLSHIMVSSEMIAMMTPLVAMGIMRITALCGSTPNITALLGLFYDITQCVVTNDFACPSLQMHCIVSSDVNSIAMEL